MLHSFALRERKFVRHLRLLWFTLCYHTTAVQVMEGKNTNTAKTSTQESGSEEYTPISTKCEHCALVSCKWEEHKEDLAHHGKNIRDGLIQGVDPSCTNSVVRKNLYRRFVFLVYGPLGKGQRIELPECVLYGIRGLYPEESESCYMGFKEHGDK